MPPPAAHGGVMAAEAASEGMDGGTDGMVAKVCSAIKLGQD